MSMPIINQNLSTNLEPTLRDLLDLYQKQTLLNLNCHHLGTIQSFDSSKQTAQVTINYTHTYFKIDPDSQKFIPYNVEYPIIADCPVVVIGGGTARITFPISKGDQCILLFNDRDIDTWFSSGATTAPNQTPSLHSFSDAIALVGPNNLSTLIQSYDSVRALITNGTVKNGINPQNNKLTLTNGTNSLNDLLQDLCTNIESLCNQLAILTVTGVQPASVSPGNVSNIYDSACFR